MKSFDCASLRCGNVLPGLAALTFAFSAHISAANTPEGDGNAAKNLARMNCGAQIECATDNCTADDVATTSEHNKNAKALIMDDNTLSCPLQEGETTFVIKLPATSLLDRFTFVNENAAAAGKLKIAVSNYRLPATSSKWVTVEGSINFSRKRLFNLSMLGVEARYVRLTFQVEKPGRIASLGLYGKETIDRFASRYEQQQQQVAWLSNVTTSHSVEDHLNFNFANSYANARIVQVSSGDLQPARRMIDDDNETSFRFEADDARPTVIVELAQTAPLRRVSAFYTMKSPGRLDVYLLNDISKSATDLSYQKPVATATDVNGDGKAAVEFDAQGARYIALRFTPLDKTALGRFEIAEINAFGDVSLAMLQVTAPDLYASSSGALQFTGQSSPDLSTTLGTVAVPPVLAQVSP